MLQLSAIILLVLISTVLALPAQRQYDEVANEERELFRALPQKREVYVTFQDRAQSTCIGLCMYHDKKPYYRCQNKCKIGRPIDKSGLRK